MGKVCCFFGHRRIVDTLELRKKLFEFIEDLILYKNVDTFLFGSKSDFNSLCHKIVSDAKEKHPHIRRIYVRAEYPYINDSYKNYILKDYEYTYYPESILSAAKAVYIERNCYMINKSDFCIVYYCSDYKPSSKKSNCSTKSGTKIAYEYAKQKGKCIINIY